MKKPNNVIPLPVRISDTEEMSARRVLSVALQRNYSQVAVVAFTTEGELEIISTPMECRDMLWAAKGLENEALYGPQEGAEE